MKPASRQVLFDRVSLAVMLAGVAMVLQPWWTEAFRLGFAVTGAGVLLQIVAAHLPGGIALEETPPATEAEADAADPAREAP